MNLANDSDTLSALAKYSVRRQQTYMVPTRHSSQGIPSPTVALFDDRARLLAFVRNPRTKALIESQANMRQWQGYLSRTEDIPGCDHCRAVERFCEVLEDKPSCSTCYVSNIRCSFVAAYQQDLLCTAFSDDQEEAAYYVCEFQELERHLFSERLELDAWQTIEAFEDFAAKHEGYQEFSDAFRLLHVSMALGRNSMLRALSAYLNNFGYIEETSTATLSRSEAAAAELGEPNSDAYRHLYDYVSEVVDMANAVLRGPPKRTSC